LETREVRIMSRAVTIRVKDWRKGNEGYFGKGIRFNRAVASAPVILFGDLSNSDIKDVNKNDLVYAVVRGGKLEVISIKSKGGAGHFGREYKSQDV